MSLAVLMISLVVLLTACGIPDGINKNFYYNAKAVFDEIDDDTMEMELSDKDDILNFELLDGVAVSDKEQKVAASIKIIVELQPKMIKGDKSTFKKYFQARETYYRIMEIDAMNKRQFQFTEK